MLTSAYLVSVPTTCKFCSCVLTLRGHAANTYSLIIVLPVRISVVQKGHRLASICSLLDALSCTCRC